MSLSSFILREVSHLSFPSPDMPCTNWILCPIKCLTFWISLYFLVLLFNLKMEINWQQTLFSWAPNSLWTVTAAMKLKDACFLEEKQ